VHSEGCLQNGMIHVGIELGGGSVHSASAWEVAFEAAAEALASRLLASAKE
jgi:hypothetical protein